MKLPNRYAVVHELATWLASIHCSHPLRVAVDGRTASGKTTIADELAMTLKDKERDVIRTSIDGFHRPQQERYARGRHSAEGYYHDARDLSAISSHLLIPLGPGGNLHYRTASFDLEKEQPIEQEPQLASTKAILIVDGTFLQRPELRDNWDVKIFIETSEEISELRGIGRDAERLGGMNAAKVLYALRYKPAFALYDTLCAPRSTADVIVNNNDVDKPMLKWQTSRNPI